MFMLSTARKLIWWFARRKTEFWSKF